MWYSFAMNSKTSALPDDPVELKKIIAQIRAEKESLRQHYESENELLREQIRHLYDKLFGRKSEKHRYAEDSPQLRNVANASSPAGIAGDILVTAIACLKFSTENPINTTSKNNKVIFRIITLSIIFKER